MGLSSEPPERTPLTVDAVFLAGIFSELEIGTPIGRGGFGAIWRVERRRLRRALALKILDPALTRDPAALARFEREMLAAGRLDHPGIVRTHDAGERGGVCFLTMEFIEGADLGVLSSDQSLSVADACDMVRQAALALDHAHGCGLVHRDVKPRNLMLARDGVVKVLDFGLAHLAQPGLGEVTLTVSGEFLGSLDYIAPEQVEHPAAVDARADIYGLGATLYRLLTGHAPHGQTKSNSMFAQMKQITSRPAAPVATLRPDLPDELAALVDRMLALDRAARPATAAEVASLLAPFCAGADLPALAREWSEQHPASATVALIPVPAPLPPRSNVVPTLQAVKQKPWLAMLTGVLLIIALAVGWAQFTKPAPTVAPKAAPTTPAVAEPWQDFTRHVEKLELSKGVEQTPDGLLLPASARIAIPGIAANGAIRIRAFYNPVIKPVLMSRAFGPGCYGLYVFTSNTVLLQFWDNEFNRAKPIQTFPISAPVQPGQEYELELRAVGATLTVKLNGQILGSAEDSRLTSGGFVIVTGSGGRGESPPALVRSIEILDLDKAESGGR
jgi:serine/threonine protein kinase